MRKKVCNRCGKIVSGKCDCKAGSFTEIRPSQNNEGKKESSILNTSRWRKKRVEIIKRDSGYCQRCWIKYHIINDTEIQVHHIKSRYNYPELTFEDNNLITLCKTCNIQLGTNDKLDFRWEPPTIKDYTL